MEALRGVGAPGRMTLGVGFRPCAVALAVALALGLSACGGGGGGGGGANVKPTQPPPPPAGDTTFTGGEIDVDANSVTVLPDNLSGSINLIKGGAGTLALTGTSTYAGGTTINLGTLQLGNGGTTGSIVGNIVDNGTLAFNRSDDFSFANTVSGTGGLIKNGTNVLTLTGSNSYNGSLQVQAGGLYVDGDQTAAMGATTVAGGATLGGKGIIGGNVTVADGATLAPGSKGAIGTLTMNGNLSLSSGSKLNYDFAAPDASGARLGDFIFVRGDLTLDGVLNVNLAAGDMPGPGVYHLFFYGGTLIDNGLSVPDGWLVQTGSEKNVNLINTQGMTFSFWDVGAKNDHVNNGGGGIWQNNSPASNTNWTDASGAVNTTFNDGSFAVFQGAYGTVTVDAANGDINVAGMELGNGYVVQGDAIHMVGSENDPTHSIIRVANGTTAGLTYAATINSVLAGSVGLVKTDAGTLVLGGENTYTGGTTVSGGTLQIGNRFTSGSIIGNVTDNATLAFFRSDLYNFDGVISGSGSVTQAGIGTLVLTGNNTYGGGTTISDGVLQIGNGGTTGWITGDIVNNRYVRFNRGDDVIFNSNITGTGALIKDGAGTLILTGNLTEDGTQTYYNTDPTTISAGTLQIGNGGTTGSITGDITNNASLVFDRSDTVTFDGKVSGNGSMTQAGTGTLILTNSNYLPNGITISRGTLQVGNGGTTGQIFGGDTTNSGTLVFNYGSSPGTIFGYGGLISGSGNLIKEGAGAFSLSANNTYTGGTLISGGTLQLGSQGSTGWVAGDITNNGKLAFNRTDDVVFSHQVTGTGSVQKMGFNTLTVTGDFKNTGVTEIDLGTLQIGNGGTTGSLVGDVVNGGTLAFDRSNDLTYSGAISGTYGKLIKLGTNTLTLTGVNTFGSLRIDGATYVTDGTLRVASGASLSSKILVGGNNAHAVLQIDQGASTGFAELEDGATVDNSGVMTTEAVNVPFVSGGAVNVLNHNGGVIDNEHPSYSIDVPAVQLGLNSTLTNGTGSLIRGFTGVTSQGVVNNTGGTISGNFSDGISGSPTLVNNTNGGQITSGSNPPYNFPISFGIETFANSAVINNLGASIILGKNSGILMSDGGIVTNDGASIISGNVGVSIGSQSSATSTVNNTGGSKITGAQEGIGLGFGGTVINGAGSTIEATAAPSGDCSVTLACSIYVPVYHAFGNYGSNGTLTLSNAGYIVGDVQMDPGVINNITLIAGGYIHGALRIGVNTQSTLTLDGTAGTTQLYSNAVTGATTFGGNLIKNGGGTWVLDDNALQGVVNTSINAGSLHATQALSGDVVANAGGTLDGVPGVTGNLTNAGKVAVHGGDSAIGGNYTQVPTGTLAVSLGSKLAVNGSAALGGTLEITGAGSGYTSNTHTDVLTATGGVTGTFSQLAKDTGVVFTATTINYNANSVWLDTTGLNITAAIMRSGGSFTPASLGSAQRVQSAFTQLDKKIASGTLSDVPDNFVKAAGEFQQAPTVQAAQASLQSLSGQLHAASAAMTFEAIDASSRALADRFDDLLGKNIGYGMWTQNLDVGGDMGRAGFDGVGFQLNGWLVGNDLKIGSSGVAGFAFGQSQGKQQLEQGYDHNHSRNTEGMFYAGALNGNWYTQGRIGFGHFQQDVNRQLLLGTSAQGVGTAYSGNYNVAYGETGLHLNWAGSRIMPFVNVEYASIDRGGFAEQGAGGFGLQANAQTLDRWQAGVGLRANHHWDFGDGRALDFHASAQFQRTLASRGDVFEASFVGLQQWQPLLGIGLSRYSGVLNVGLDARLSPRTSLNFGYDYENGQRDQAQMLSAHLVMAF